MKEILIKNIDNLHTTKLGIERIKNNLNINTENIVDYYKNKILKIDCSVYRNEKNFYCEIDNIIITVNANSYTIITAHKIK